MGQNTRLKRADIAFLNSFQQATKAIKTNAPINGAFIAVYMKINSIEFSTNHLISLGINHDR
jgi:hypothetical protein